MSDGALRIPITGDASQFKKTLSQLEADLKSFKEKLKSAKGDEIVKFNVDIQGTKQAINDLTTFGKFAEGTLGRLYQQLEQLKTLRLTIQADATALTPVNNAIDETTKKIKDLLSAGLQKPIVEAAQVSANSIQGLKNRIDELNQKKLNLDAKDDYLQIVKLNQEIDKLKTQINNLNKLGLKVDQTIDPAVNSFRNLTNTSNKSRQALTSLSLVAQDLPFGFIAIQNNLPAVISSFGALNASSNGIKGTLAALGAGLVGPAGLFLAFSVVTGAITYAVQKYGSLDAAVKDFFGTTTKLDIVLNKSAESLQKYNKELQTTQEITGRGQANASGEVFRIQTLSAAVKDVTLSEKQRANALKEIQKLDPETLKNLDLQKNGYKDLDVFVEKYTNSLIANAVAQEYLSKVVATTTQINQQSLALQEIAKGYDDIAKRRREAEAQPTFDPATGADLTPTILGGLAKATQNLNERFFAQVNIVNGLNQELNGYREELKSATLETLNFFKGTKSSEEGLGRAKKATKEYKQELQGVVGLFDMFQIKEKKTKQGLFFDFLEGLFSKNDLNQLKEAYKRIQDAQKELDKFRENQFENPSVPNEPVRVRESNELIRNKEKLAKIVDQYKKTKSAVEEVFFNPLTALFENFFQTGKLGFKQFADDALKQLQRILVSQITNKLISLLASALVPGSGFIVSAGLRNIETGALAEYLSNTPGQANFGGVVGAGMNMSGQVNVVLRGSDLIGAINRTNSTINRIG